MDKKIEKLLEKANSSTSADSSVNSAKRRFLNESGAKKFFDEVKLRLLNLNEWNKRSTGASYELFDETGEICTDKALETERFIRISIPATGKDDWVKIIEIYEAANEFVITVQPSYNPTEKSVDKSVTSHFYSREARNNFCLQRDKTEVICYVIGYDEKQNVAETANVLETVRNAAAANFGYYSGIQKAMWKEFCKKFLEIQD